MDTVCRDQVPYGLFKELGFWGCQYKRRDLVELDKVHLNPDPEEHNKRLFKQRKIHSRVQTEAGTGQK